MKHLFRAEWARVAYTGRSTGQTVAALCYASAFVGLLFNPSAWWVGAHWSSHNKRLCINLIPCLTVWVTLPGGGLPMKETK